jgi:hypothetical protein
LAAKLSIVTAKEGYVPGLQLANREPKELNEKTDGNCRDLQYIVGRVLMDDIPTLYQQRYDSNLHSNHNDVDVAKRFVIFYRNNSGLF